MEEGVLRGRFLPRACLTGADARENLLESERLLGGVRTPALTDLRDLRSLSADARAILAGPESTKVASRVALVVASPLSRVIGSSFVRFNRPESPTRLFGSVEAALAWLKGAEGRQGAAKLTPPGPVGPDDARLAEIMEAMIPLADGERVRPVDVHGDGSVLDGIATGLNMVAEEIGERLERDRVGEVRLREAERLAVAVQMAAKVAHEVNNPASFLLANLTVLAEHAADLGRLLATLRAELPEGSPAGAGLGRILGEAERIVTETGEICAENLEGVRRIAAVVRELNERALAPAGLAPAALAPAGLAAGAAGAARAAAPEPRPGRRLRVLLVDDDPLLLTAYRRLLEPEHEVAVAESGRQALEILARDPAWDAIVSDVVMPEVDGPELLRLLEAQFPSLVARTAFSSAGTYTARTVAFAESLGDRFVTKPLDRGQLEALVARLGSLGSAAPDGAATLGTSDPRP